MEKTLVLDNVSKTYKVNINPPRTLKESFVRFVKREIGEYKKIHALKNVSLSVEKGRTIGIIGHNGAGKSTLLRLISGIGKPTKGKITVNGRITTLLELGTGFHPDLTGRENIITGAIVNGFNKKEILERIDDIIAFSELDEYIDLPVRTYSSGMFLRLAISTALNIEPEIIVIDEILAVGDVNFQKKCVDKLLSFKSSLNSLIITSHDMNHISSLCEYVYVLEDGEIVFQGQPSIAIEHYYKIMNDRTERRLEKLGIEKENHKFNGDSGERIGTFEASIDEVFVVDGKGRMTNSIMSSDSLRLNFKYSTKHNINDIILILSIRDEFDINCFETHISLKSIVGIVEEQGRFSCYLPEVPLAPGRYFINIGLYPNDFHFTYDLQRNMHQINIYNTKESIGYTKGVVFIETKWLVD